MPASGAGWQRHWLSQNGARGGLSRLASLLHSAAAGVGDSVTPWGVSCLRVGSVAILCPALCRVWRRSGGGTIATAGRTRGGSSRPAVLSAQSACIVKRKGSTMLALSTASGCYVLIFRLSFLQPKLSKTMAQAQNRNASTNKAVPRVRLCVLSG